mgnify:CR=1 FL=1
MIVIICIVYQKLKKMVIFEFPFELPSTSEAYLSPQVNMFFNKLIQHHDSEGMHIFKLQYLIAWY